jgi:hypothetical protein
MTGNQIITILKSLTILVIVKWFFVVGLIMYSLFAVVVIKQVSVMSETVDSSVNSVMKLFSWLHLAMAILLVVAAIVML